MAYSINLQVGTNIAGEHHNLATSSGLLLKIGFPGRFDLTIFNYKFDPYRKTNQVHMTPKFFAGTKEFRKWLEKNHKKETELLVGFYKVGTGKPSMTWSQSVDEALCFGWIDGVRKSIDKDRYQIRFTPRKATSIWSAVNIKKIEELTKQGLMQPAGIASFEKRKEDKSKIYSFEKEEEKFSTDLEKMFKADKTAWKYFQALAPSYRKVSKHWVMSAKQESTRLKRLNELIAESKAGTNRWKENKYNKKIGNNETKFNNFIANINFTCYFF